MHNSIMTEPSTETSYMPQSSQTRFSFYTASDYNVEVGVEPVSSNDDSAAEDNQRQEPEQQQQQRAEPQRFTFYTAKALESPKINDNLPAENPEIDLSQPNCDKPDDNSVEDEDQVAGESLLLDEETQQSLERDEETLQSLESQRPSPEHSCVETRRSRRQSASPNPYEDAIREALELLRKHRSSISPSLQRVGADATSEDAFLHDPRTPANHDRLLQSRQTPTSTSNSRLASPSSEFSRGTLLSDAYQAEIETRRQQRQERMAKYTSRLAELKQQNAPHEDETDDHSDADDVQPAASDEASVQAGVERVLLAILERAGSRGRGGSRCEAQRQFQTHSSWTRGEEKKSVEDENALLQAMSDLLGSSSVLSHPTKQSEDAYDPVTASRSMDSVEPSESCVEKEEVDDGDDSALNPPILTRTTITHLDTSSEAVEAVASIESPGLQLDLKHVPTAQSQDHDELDELVRQFSSATSTSGSHRHVIKHPIEERVRQILSSDSSTDKRDEDRMIPERMMKTCVEVERERFQQPDTLSVDYQSSSSSDNEDVEDEESELASSIDADDDQHDSSVDRVLGPLAKSNTTTGVVLEPDSPEPSSNGVFETISAVMSLVTGDPPVSPTSSEATKDRYADADDSSESDESSDSSDDSSFSEANDLMRSLCAHLLPTGVDQTCRVLDPLPAWDNANPDEPGYRIVRLRGPQLSRVEEEFEAMIVKLKHNSQRDLSKLGEGSGSDAMFERDLKAAEDLLEKEEMRLLDTPATGPATAAPASKSTKNGDTEVNISTDYEPPLAAFPSVKEAGKGEMGDLEYFHLPVIFKSHVTGFEPTKDMYLEAGNIIAGQYLVEGELGSAAFSTAYRCIDLSSEGDGPDGHQEVCLKVIKNTKDFFDQSLDEIKILELLRQTGMCQEKSIVEMKTFFYYREHLIIVTELLRQNLFEFGKFIVDHNEEPYFTLPRLAYITRQCLVALEFVHSLNLVHSDIKPENILLGSYSRATIKIIDFGSSCYLTDRQSSYIQSRSYRAPEVVLGLPYDGRIDIWSLGCVVAEMYTGEVTFQNDSIVSMLSRIEAICGPFPRHMIAQGRQSGRFFTKCGLLYERISVGVEDESLSHRSDTDASMIRENFDIFQPKTTTLSSRLGFDADLMERYDSGDVDLSTKEKEQAVFVDFVRRVLTIEPETRLTATDALLHPWMKYASTLTEEDIKYPSA